uniref:Uncharacterized protein n=1 Tax=Anguilla anguilla TaxID=7936 RepID=A0A0E9QUT3_ANGAN
MYFLILASPLGEYIAILFYIFDLILHASVVTFTPVKDTKTA